MSSNGVIEFVDPWFDPSAEDDDQLAVMHEHMAAEDALILGRKTFEDFRALDVGRSRGENTTVLRGPIEEEVNALISQPGGDIGVTGSIDIVHALMRANLVDEYGLFVYPVATSRGRNLVPEGMSMGRLRLLKSRSFDSGVVLLTYAPRCQIPSSDIPAHWDTRTTLPSDPVRVADPAD